MLAACYCPGYDNCDASEDYVQQVGILYYFATGICMHGYQARACDPVFDGATPRSRFALKVLCPGDACLYNTTKSRIKIVVLNAVNDLPAWDSNNGCFEGVHGVSSGG